MVMMFLILTVQCLIIKQQSVMKSVCRINQKFENVLANKKYKKKDSMKLHWSLYLDNYNKLIRICQETKEYSRFWSPFLTCLILGILTDVCYLLFVCIFINETSIIEKIALYPISINSLVLIFLLTGHCAKLVKNNLKILHQNRLLFLNLSKFNISSLLILQKV